MKLLSFILILVLFSCSHSNPLKIHKNHSTSVRRAISKYRAVIDRYNWEIRQSDASGGFLKAIRPKTTMGAVIAIYTLNLSCYEKRRQAVCSIRLSSCENDVYLSNCTPVTEESIDSRWADGSLKMFVDSLKSVK